LFFVLGGKKKEREKLMKYNKAKMRKKEKRRKKREKERRKGNKSPSIDGLSDI